MTFVDEDNVREEVLNCLRAEDPEGAGRRIMLFTKDPSEFHVQYYLPRGCEELYGVEKVAALRSLLIAKVFPAMRSSGIFDDWDSLRVVAVTGTIIKGLIRCVIPEYNFEDVQICPGTKDLWRMVKGSRNMDQLAATRADERCAVCDKAYPGKRCPCKNTYYCDSTCQRAHWAIHRKTGAHKAKNDISRLE
ncbi:hypothetical protein JKP88DRAFT_264360 [Tribonema minus]|uniref:MYND-type domain-containing protein n=1 Tax=Tribonema minus TaxID=303371 RepID=A0A835YSF4_9STRA|nr:hypothetical protein JKP88DRAFT_264360 [Tribonema minus]